MEWGHSMVHVDDSVDGIKFTFNTDENVSGGKPPKKKIKSW